MDKETMAKALFEAEFAEDKVTWDTANDGYKELFGEYAEAVIKALEAEAPKELEECLLSPEEIENITENIALSYIGEKAYKAKDGDLDKEISIAVAKAQLQSPKLAPCINAQVKAEVDATAKAFIKLMNDRIVAEVQTERERILGLLDHYSTFRYQYINASYHAIYKMEELIKEVSK